MNELIQQPSEQTVDIFIKMRMRWNFLVNSFQFLENHWQEWATWQDRLEIIWYKFGTDSAESELIHAVYLFFEQINPENCGLGAKEYATCNTNGCRFRTKCPTSFAVNPAFRVSV